MNTVVDLKKIYGKRAVHKAWGFAFSNFPCLWHDLFFYADREHRLVQLLERTLEEWRPPNQRFSRRKDRAAETQAVRRLGGTMFEDRKVEAKSVVDFLEKYYRHDRYHGRGEDYAAVVLASHEKDFAEQGYTIISRYESVTGQVVAYFGNRLTPASADAANCAARLKREPLDGLKGAE